jgi:hypothetical protein
VLCALQAFFDLPERRDELVLAQRGRQVAARTLQDGAEGVGRSAEAACDRVGIVDRYQETINLVHGIQQSLAIACVSAP